MEKSDHHLRSITCMLLLLLLVTAGEARENPEFIRETCNSTLYPNLCEKSLSAHASDIRHSARRAATLALSLSLHHAESAASSVSRLYSDVKSVTAGGGRDTASAAAGDCLTNMNAAAGQLRQSIRQMGRMGRAGSSSFAYRLNNIQTWASAAITDADTCLEELDGLGLKGPVKDAVRKKVLKVAQMTSNALALVNSIARKP